ncbi:hypothetical protein WICPIJ_006362 [Wickerhamomyces pijperi]|uniref:Uncharacterized protein n=1 Tax=Wickerhamomyces pijperi TaxID=599730 RepID=A0A9P8TKA2_WICPI|nr:hypothetical protein WICPIJ_006362 [Wickerhamomyces pijperi]
MIRRNSYAVRRTSECLISQTHGLQRYKRWKPQYVEQSSPFNVAKRLPAYQSYTKVLDSQNYMDLFPPFIWEVIFLHLDSYETIYELMLECMKFDDSLKKLSCPTLKLGLVPYIRNSSLIPVYIKYCPSIATLERIYQSKRVRYSPGDLKFGTDPPFGSKDGLELFTTCEAYCVPLFVDAEYKLLPHKSNDYTMAFLNSFKSFGHSVVFQVHSYGFPESSKKGSTGPMDLQQLVDWHFNAITKLFLPKTLQNLDMKTETVLPFRMHIEIYETPENILGSCRGNDMSAPQLYKLLGTLFKKEARSSQRYLRNISEWQVNVDAANNNDVALEKFSRCSDLKVPGKQISKEDVAIKTYGIKVDLVLSKTLEHDKASKNEDDTPKVSKRLKQLSKNLFSRLFKRSSSNEHEQGNVPCKSLRSIDSKEGQLQFLQHCFPGTALDHFRFEQVQTPVSSGKEKDAFDGYTKYESDSDTEIETKTTPSALDLTKLYKKATTSPRVRVHAVRFRL